MSCTLRGRISEVKTERTVLHPSVSLSAKDTSEDRYFIKEVLVLSQLPIR